MGIQQSPNYTIERYNERISVVRFERSMDEEINDKVHHLCAAIEANPFLGFIEAIPTYATVAVYYDVFRIYEQSKEVEAFVHQHLEHLILQSWYDRHLSKKVVYIPVCYGGKYGPDLREVAAYHRMLPEEVIAEHTAKLYPVYMIGFAPGFPYLGGVSERIAVPRRSTPRKKIPAGSVGIAGRQTGIYPFASPGGWQIIGRTPLSLFHVDQDPPTHICPGNKVKFTPITASEYEEWGHTTGGAS
ncbi:5-oxoprolinase subunit PxpB [Longirhabdus pacifica]|uniref:5-oxoprolinase subunit PxpB n=1 Tax=Longirhabdus pacifica TaxID=2305227 RepID=UPI001008FF9F|nr:5-oxoprolinase subunit PxpB [Longirhabdus pacifica]